MKVAEIREALDEFGRLYADHGRAAEATALRTLTVFLKDHEGSSVSALASAIRASRPKKATSIDLA